MTQYGDSGSPSRSREYTIERSGGCSERRHHGRAVTLSRTARMEGRFAVLPQVRQVGPEVPSMAPVAGPLPNRGERHERLRGLLPPAADDEHALRKEVNSARDDRDDAGRLPIHGTPSHEPERASRLEDRQRGGVREHRLVSEHEERPLPRARL